MPNTVWIYVCMRLTLQKASKRLSLYKQSIKIGSENDNKSDGERISFQIVPMISNWYLCLCISHETRFGWLFVWRRCCYIKCLISAQRESMSLAVLISSIEHEFFLVWWFKEKVNMANTNGSNHSELLRFQDEQHQLSHEIQELKLKRGSENKKIHISIDLRK